MVEGLNNSSLSSTSIRKMVSTGDMEIAEIALSRPYMVIGQSDSDGRVWVSEALKLLPPEGGYTVLINGEQGRVNIDNNGAIACDVESTKVIIQFKSNRL